MTRAPSPFRNLSLVLALLMPAAAIFSGCAHGSRRQGPPPQEKGRLVEAEGWSPIDPKNPYEARQRALAEAQKKAVEKVMGVTVSANTKIEAAISVRQRIEANSGGHIRRYDVLSERAEDGFLSVVIRAFVLYGPPDPPPNAAKNIRVSLAIPDEALAGAIRTALRGRGFPVSTGAEVADFVLTGTAQAYALDGARFGGFQSYRARVTLQAVRSKTGEIVRRTYEASAIDPVPGIAREKAVENAGLLAAGELAARMESDFMTMPEGGSAGAGRKLR